MQVSGAIVAVLGVHVQLFKFVASNRAMVTAPTYGCPRTGVLVLLISWFCKRGVTKHAVVWDPQWSTAAAETEPNYWAVV